jgi:AcrR family transcriptional regulator
MSTAPTLTAARRRTRQAIIDAAIGVLVRQRDATLADIAAAAGTSRSTLHRHFADRADLLHAAVADALAAIARATTDAALERGDAMEALRRLVGAYLDIGDRIRFLFEDPGLAAEHPEITELATAEGPVVGLIERGQAAGAIASSLSAVWIERVLWAVVFAGAEAVDDGTLARHEALSAVLGTIERGVAGSAAT